MADDRQPLKKVFLMGLRNSGKTSIHRVVFNGVPPIETMHQETTTKLTKVDAISNGFVKFHLWDFPGQTDWITNAGPSFNFAKFLDGCGAIIFVIDVSPPKDDREASPDDFERFQEAHDKLLDVITAAHAVDPNIHFEVFLHKVDKLTKQEDLEEVNRHISTSVLKEIQHSQDAQAPKVHLTFHSTSIYDHSVFKAFSQVVQKIVPQLPYLRAVIEMLVTNSRLQQAMLFDTTSRIFIAADNSISVHDNSTYELFVEALQLVGTVNSMFPPVAEESDVADLPETSLLAGGTSSDSQFAATKFSAENHAIVRLGNKRTVYVKELTPTLALVAAGDDDAFFNKSLIDYNVGIFSQAVIDLFNL
jgi:Ras-related GTP-binding protein C/D